jgi:hypothetical protein
MSKSKDRRDATQMPDDEQLVGVRLPGGALASLNLHDKLKEALIRASSYSLSLILCRRFLGYLTTN